jgi:hypothetical protein
MIFYLLIFIFRSPKRNSIAWRNRTQHTEWENSHTVGKTVGFPCDLLDCQKSNVTNFPDRPPTRHGRRTKTLTKFTHSEWTTNIHTRVTSVVGSTLLLVLVCMSGCLRSECTNETDRRYHNIWKQQCSTYFPACVAPTRENERERTREQAMEMSCVGRVNLNFQVSFFLDHICIKQSFSHREE